MRTEQMKIDEAVKRGLALPFALVRSLSQVTLGPTPETVALEELLEARFFDQAEEIRVFQGEDSLQAVQLIQEEDDICLEETRTLMNPVFGAEITIGKVVAFDEDGQAYLATTRLTGWKGEVN